jgi:hypothetical protein
MEGRWLAQLRGDGAYRIPFMQPQDRRQELSNWCSPCTCRGDDAPAQFRRRGAASKLGGCRATFAVSILLAPSVGHRFFESDRSALCACKLLDPASAKEVGNRQSNP